MSSFVSNSYEITQVVDSDVGTKHLYAKMQTDKLHFNHLHSPVAYMVDVENNTTTTTKLK